MTDIDPTSLTVGALKPADLSLAARLAGGSSVETKQRIDPGPKRRGRPPGSTNKPTEQADAEKAKAALEKKLKAKQERADELTEQILTELNDQIISLFVDRGMPSSVFYRPGMGPKLTDTNERFTEAGNRVTIKRQQAKYIAKFIAEIEASDNGQKVTTALSDGLLSQIIAGGLALGSVAMYARSMYQFRKEMLPALEAYKLYQAQQEQQRRNAGQ